MLVKSFTDELAWEVQRQLVNTYFRVQLMNSLYDDTIYKKMEVLDKKIDSLKNDMKDMENNLGNVSEDTIQTIVPCFYLEDEKINSLEKKICELEKKSAKTIKDIQRIFNLLNKKSERVASAVRENSKLLAKFMKMFE